MYYLNAESKSCAGKERILHVTPKYFTFLLTNDHLQDQFVGRYALLQVSFGTNAFVASKHEQLMVPGQKLLSTIPKFTYESDDAIDAHFMEEFDNSERYPIESISEYGFGFWSRFLSTIPARMLAKPRVMQIARLLADRPILSLSVAFEHYLFDTYSVDADALQGRVNYDELEGIWRYAYLSYSRVKSTAVCHILPQKSVITPVLHKPLLNHAAIELIYGDAAFQGVIAKLTVHFGQGSFIEQTSQIEKWVQSSYVLGADLTDD